VVAVVKVLDLFAGLCGWSAPFAERGHEVYSVDIDERFDVSSHADILTLTAADLPWKPDIILASPPCEGFSVLRIGQNWNHRSLGIPNTPKTPTAELGLALVAATLRLIDEIEPAFWVIENPRAMLRKLPLIAGRDRRTVTFCQYGTPYMKPTDLWGGFPPSLVMRPMCKPRGTCHVASPRGSTTGVQGYGSGVVRCPGCSRRFPMAASCPECGMAVSTVATPRAPGTAAEQRALSAKIPAELALDVCLAAERDLAAGDRPVPTSLWAVA
jgi:hypothetical protein